MRQSSLKYIVDNLPEWPKEETQLRRIGWANYSGSEIVIDCDGFTFTEEEYNSMKTNRVTPKGPFTKGSFIAQDGFIEVESPDNPNIKHSEIIQAIIHDKKFQFYDSKWIDTTYEKVCQLVGTGDLDLIRVKPESPVISPLSTDTLYYIPAFNSSGFDVRKWTHSKEDAYCLTNRWVFLTSEGAQNISKELCK